VQDDIVYHSAGIFCHIIYSLFKPLKTSTVEIELVSAEAEERG